MKSLHLRAGWIWGLLVAFAAVTNWIVLSTPGFSITKALFGFIWLFILPGWMLTRMLKLWTANPWERLSFTVALSILGVMVAGLAINTLVPHLGNPYPLGVKSLLGGLDVSWLALVAVTWWRNHGAPIRIPLPEFAGRDLVTGLAGLPLVVLAVLGATILNNGGTSVLTWSMLALAAVYLGILVALRDRVSETALATGIYWVALSLLLMTSLRGWFITGHDVQREFHVFSITLNHLNWNIANYNDAYNACLSITILPTVIKQIMGVGELYVYKTVFQMVFALVPVLVYLIARRYNTRFVALLSSIYFVAFPTYFSDMPMLNRQEIAFLFMALTFLVIFNRTWSLGRRRWLICLLGIGVILSHYSTTYFMLGMFGLFIVMRAVLRVFGDIAAKATRRRLSLADWRLKQPAPVSVFVISILLAASYIWSVKLTNTGGNVSGLVTQTIQSIERGVSSDTKSSDTSYSLLGGSKLTDQQRLDAYARQTAANIRADIPAAEQYPDAAYPSSVPQVAPLTNLALTPTGRFLNSLGFPVMLFNTLARQGSALFLQLALVAGVALLFFGRAAGRRLSGDYRLFQAASLLFVAAVVVLPVLSAQYGLLRAFQQILMIAGTCIVLATVSVVPKRFRQARQFLPAALAIGFFVSSTGIITTGLGGYPAQLQLANAGTYYDLYYTHTTEQRASVWLAATVQGQDQLSSIATSVDTNGFIFDQIDQLPAAQVSDNGIYPSLITKNDYVFLGYTATVKHQAVIYNNGDLITYRYPTDFLDANKDLLYTNNESKIYR